MLSVLRKLPLGFAVACVVAAAIVWFGVGSRGVGSREGVHRADRPPLHPLKVLILRGELRCVPLSRCAPYWSRYVAVNEVDEIYIITPRNITAKSLFHYRGERYGDVRDIHYGSTACTDVDKTRCVYDEQYLTIGKVNETEVRSAFGPKLKALIITDDDPDVTARIDALQERLSPLFPAFTPNVDRQFVHHLQAAIVFERFFKDRPGSQNALFSVNRQDLLIFKVKDEWDKANARVCLDLIPRPTAYGCMLSTDTFSVDIFTGDNAANVRTSDFSLNIDYATFLRYAEYASQYGQYACHGDYAGCKRCGLQYDRYGDYRIAENQFFRWERLHAPNLRPHHGLFKFMFIRTNAAVPAFMVRQPINVTAADNWGPCRNADDCCGVRPAIDPHPRQHDNRSCYTTANANDCP